MNARDIVQAVKSAIMDHNFPFPGVRWGGEPGTLAGPGTIVNDI